MMRTEEFKYRAACRAHSNEEILKIMVVSHKTPKKMNQLFSYSTFNN